MMPQKLSKALIFCHKYGIMNAVNLLAERSPKVDEVHPAAYAEKGFLLI